MTGGRDAAGWTVARVALVALFVALIMPGVVGGLLVVPGSGSTAASDTIGADGVARCDLSATRIAPGNDVTLDASGSEMASGYQYDKYGADDFGPERDAATQTFTYDEVGTYEPQVRILDEAGHPIDTASCGTLTVEANEPPRAKIGGSGPFEVDVGEPFEFGSTSVDPDGSVVAYEWRVDGTVAGEGVSFTHTFEAPGEHRVELTVTDDDGATDSTSATVIVVGANEPPSVELAASPADPALGESVTFVADAMDPDGNIVAYEWHVDGEPVAGGPAFAHTFEDPGDYQVGVTVTDDAGATATAETSIEVQAPTTEPPPPNVRLSAEWWYAPLDPRPGDLVALVARGNASPEITYRWDLDDNGDFEKRGGVVTHGVTEPGEYTVTLRTTGPAGRTKTQSRTIVVGARQNGGGGGQGGPSLWYAPLNPRPGQTVVLNANPGADVETVDGYRWDLNADGDFEARGQSVTRTMPSNGRFSVRLVVERTNGSSVTVEETVSHSDAAEPTTAPGDEPVGTTAVTRAEGSGGVVPWRGIGVAVVVLAGAAGLLWRWYG